MRVRYAEIDAQRIVFNTRYLEYLDVGVTEYFRLTGLHDLEHPDAGSAEFHVARNTIDYKKALEFDEEFDVCLRCAHIGNSSIQFLYEIHGLTADEDLRAMGETISVHVGELGSPPTRVPSSIVRIFEAFEGTELRAAEKVPA
jgi:acyl-CoA thioester hydrolase